MEQIRSALAAVMPPGAELPDIAVTHRGIGNTRDVFPLSDLAAETIAAG